MEAVDGGSRDYRRHRKSGRGLRGDDGDAEVRGGLTRKSGSVEVPDDAREEGAEALTLTLSNASGSVIVDDTATGEEKGVSGFGEGFDIARRSLFKLRREGPHSSAANETRCCSLRLGEESSWVCGSARGHR